MGRELSTLWLERARGSLNLAIRGKQDGVFLEDLCFHAQQAAEKAVKALLLDCDQDVPRTHSLTALLQEIPGSYSIPGDVREAVDLNDYAVQSRYPGDYCPVGEEEYNRAIVIAARVVDWVSALLAE